MAEKWQHWMPLDINEFRGSPSVQAMHPAARAGYLYLLMTQWESEDCTLPDDPVLLGIESGLGDALWMEFGAHIVRKFDALDNHKLRNMVCFEKWKEAKKVFEARRQGAQNTNSQRSANGHRAVSARRAHTRTGTGTVTEVLKNNNHSPSDSPEPAVAFQLPAISGASFGVTAAQLEKWRGLYLAVDVEAEVRKMIGWLDAHPTQRKTLRGMPAFASRWLGKAQDEARAPPQDGRRPPGADRHALRILSYPGEEIS